MSAQALPASALIDDSETETENDRFKKSFESWLWSSMIAATVFHFALFQFWPDCFNCFPFHNLKLGNVSEFKEVNSIAMAQMGTSRGPGIPSATPPFSCCRSRRGSARRRSPRYAGA